MFGNFETEKAVMHFNLGGWLRMRMLLMKRTWSLRNSVVTITCRIRNTRSLVSLMIITALKKFMMLGSKIIKWFLHFVIPIILHSTNAIFKYDVDSISSFFSRLKCLNSPILLLNTTNSVRGDTGPTIRSTIAERVWLAKFQKPDTLHSAFYNFGNTERFFGGPLCGL